MTAAVDAMGLAREERADLADLLTTLTPAQWAAPSLCAGWRVRDVVAHLFSYEELGVAGLVGRFLRGGVLPDRVNAVGVAVYAEQGTDGLLALVGIICSPGVSPPASVAGSRSPTASSTTGTCVARSACIATSP